MPPTIPIAETLTGTSPGARSGAPFVVGELSLSASTTPPSLNFTQVGSEHHAVPEGGLSPESNFFDSPSPGVLRYVGDSPLRARVSYAVSVTVTASPAKTPFFSALQKNGELVLDTVQQGTIDASNLFLSFSGSSDKMLSLEPGDTLQVAVAGFVTGDYSTLITALVILASRI